jgi:hypothetical protein
MTLRLVAMLVVPVILLMSGCAPTPDTVSGSGREQPRLPTAIPGATSTPRPPVTISADTAQQMTSLLVRGTSITVGAFHRALDEFRQAQGRFPTDEEGLSVLKQPAAAGKASGGSALDAWKQPFRFRAQSTHGQERPDIWSAGPDGQDDTADDIGNWTLDAQ